MTVVDDAPVVDESGLVDQWPSDYEIVALDDLIVDRRYQRDPTTLVDKIAENFNKAMVGTLIVSRRRKGKMAIVDGQTRFLGAQKSGKVVKLPCLVFEDMTIAEEARLFADLQRNRRNIATHERFKSDLVAGDPMAKDIARILKKVGLEVGGKKGQLKSPAALEAVWRRDHHVEGEGDAATVIGPPKGPSLLEDVVDVLTRAWSGQEDFKEVWSADMIRGVGRFLQGDGVNKERLIDRLGQYTSPGKLKLRAGMLREGKGGGGHTSMYMADALLTEYTRRG